MPRPPAIRRAESRSYGKLYATAASSGQALIGDDDGNRLVKIGSRVVRHGRSITFQMVAVTAYTD